MNIFKKFIDWLDKMFSADEQAVIEELEDKLALKERYIEQLEDEIHSLNKKLDRYSDRLTLYEELIRIIPEQELKELIQNAI